MQIGEPGGSTIWLFGCVGVEAQRTSRAIRVDAHRVRGVFSVCFALSTVESFLFLRSYLSSRPLSTPLQSRMQAKKRRNPQISRTILTLWKSAVYRRYLMKSDSRS